VQASARRGIEVAVGRDVVVRPENRTNATSSTGLDKLVIKPAFRSYTQTLDVEKS